MSSVRRERTLRWTAVAVGLAAVVALPALVGAAPVPSSGLTARQVVDAALRSEGVAYSGLAEVDGHAGLPVLPFASDATALLDQSTRVRVWWSSARAWRTDTLSGSGQREEVATGEGTLAYDYEADTVAIRTTTPGLRLPRASDLVPPAAARALLGWVGPTDRVTALPARRVAGVAAAGARVTPTDVRTSLGRVDVWVDPASGLPLEIDVYARGAAEPAFRSRLLDVSVGAPPADLLSPVLPSTARWTGERRDLVSTVKAQGLARFPQTLAGLPAIAGVGLPAGIATYGTGYSRVAVLQLPRRLVPRVAAVTAGPAAQLLQVDGAQVSLLGSPLLQVALVVTDRGAGFVVVGTLTSTAMADLVRASVPALVTATRAAP